MNKLTLLIVAIIGMVALGEARATPQRFLGPPTQSGPATVPETGGTFLLLAGAFAAIAALRYKLNK